MNANTATDFITANKGTDIVVVLTDGTTHYGSALSVNTKGVNIKVDGVTRSFNLKRIDVLEVARDNDEAEVTLNDKLNEVADEISDGATTAEVAAALSEVLEREITPKELRVHLRALGLGVGKGRKYALSAGELRAVHNVITAEDLAAAAATN